MPRVKRHTLWELVAGVFLLVLFSTATAFAGPKSCYSCHNDAKQKFSRRYQHAPVAKEDCESCHIRHGFSNMLILKEKGQKLCTGCHEDFEKSIQGKAHVHPAVKEQLCTTCHDPHASDRPGLMRKVDGDLACFVCHESMIDTTGHPAEHAPFAERQCDICHVAHAGDDANLLKISGDDLCATCHEAAKTGKAHADRGLDITALTCVGCHDPHRSTRKAFVSDRVHAPVGEGMCDACHQGAAVNGNALGPADSTWAGCEGCHDGIAAKRQASVPHAPAADGECFVCHTAHRSRRPDLLKAGVAELCASCHEDKSAKELAKGQSVHAPVVEGRCQICHDPHGADRENLLVAAGDSLCTGCHSSDKFTHSNHLQTADLACLDCHRPHSSSQQKLLREDLRTTCANCHEPDLTPGMVAHKPVRDGDCGLCHDPHAGQGKANLRATVPQLCFSCHQNIARFAADSVKHPPTEECLSCHGSHEAPKKKLLLKDPAALCSDCHDTEVQADSRSVHAPFADGDCAGCHNPHGSNCNNLLGPRRQMQETPMGMVLKYPVIDSTAVSLCRTCHQKQIKEWQDRTTPHAPVIKGQCDACHAPHQAGEPHLLKAAAGQLCRNCHDPSTLNTPGHNGFDLKGADCSQCHDPHGSNETALLRAKPHMPFAERDCEVCHSAPGSLILNDAQPGLCLACHEDIETQLSLDSFHEPAKNGQCTTCHNPHTSNEDHLLVQSPPGLCETCHEKNAGTDVHAPYGNGECGSCHEPHGSAEASLLKQAPPDLCLGCHTQLADRLKKGRVHPALEEGCLACHESHVSDNPSLLSASVIETCTACHDTGEARWKSSHGDNRPGNCVSCHDPHVSSRQVSSLLKETQHPPFAERNCDACHEAGSTKPPKATRALCGQCHEDLLQTIDSYAFPHKALADSAGCAVCHSPHDGDTPALLRRSGFAVCLTCHKSIQLTNTNVHPPAAEDCAICHTPHGGDNALLLEDTDIMQLCTQCHDAAKSRHFHPMGEGTKDPTRPGEVVCTSCHSPHNSDQTALLLGDPDRGLCVRCHDPSGHSAPGGKKK